jgi:flavin-binding protein dodecin
VSRKKFIENQEIDIMAEPYQRGNDGGNKSKLFLGRRGSLTLEAIEDLLAQADRIRDVTSDAVSELCARRDVDLRRRLHRGRRRLYQRYLEHCLEDRVVSVQESEELAHLGALLHLEPADLVAIHDEVAVAVYGEAVEEVLADYRLDDDEEIFLRRLRESLDLSEVDAERLYSQGSSRARDRAFNEAASPDPQFISPRATAGTFTGRSAASFDAAIDDALTKASIAAPNLHWFKVSVIAGYVEEGRASGWHVTLQAGLRDVE